MSVSYVFEQEIGIGINTAFGREGLEIGYKDEGVLTLMPTLTVRGRSLDSVEETLDALFKAVSTMHDELISLRGTTS